MSLREPTSTHSPSLGQSNSWMLPSSMDPILLVCVGVFLHTCPLKARGCLGFDYSNGFPGLPSSRGGHSHIPLVIALPVVKVKSRVKGHFLTLHLGSNGTFNNCNITDCNSTCVVKESRGQFWHSHRVKCSSGESKLLTDVHGRDCSIYGSDHPV